MIYIPILNPEIISASLSWSFSCEKNTEFCIWNFQWNAVLTIEMVYYRLTVEKSESVRKELVELIFPVRKQIIFLCNEENFSISLATKTERTAATSWNSWWTGAERPVSSSIDSSIHSSSSTRNKRVCTVGSFENNTRAVPHSIWKCLSHYRNRELHFQRANTFAQISRALFGILE